MNYTVKTALVGLWHDRWLNVLCVLTVGTSLLMIALAIVGYLNLKAVTDRMPDRFTVTVFIDEDTTEERVRDIITKVRGFKGVKKVKFISKEDGFKELKASLGDADYVLEGIEGNPLPDSLEVQVTRRYANTKRVNALVGKVLAIREVDDAYYAPELLRIVSAAGKFADKLGAALIIALGLAGLFVSYATIKILFYRKQEEIDTMKLLGATKGFILAPFLIEGAAIGLTGGMLSFTGFLSLYAFVYMRLSTQFAIVKALVVPIQIFPALPLAGLMIGLVGAMIAIGRIRF